MAGGKKKLTAGGDDLAFSLPVYLPHLIDQANPILPPARATANGNIRAKISGFRQGHILAAAVLLFDARFVSLCRSLSRARRDGKTRFRSVLPYHRPKWTGQN